MNGDGWGRGPRHRFDRVTVLSAIGERLMARPAKSLTAAVLTVFFAAGLALAPATTALAVDCTAANIGVTSLHGSTFYTDDSPSPPSNPKLQGQYEGYRITNNTGSPLSGLWTKIDSFNAGSATSIIGLAPSEDGIDQLKSLSSGASDISYFFVAAIPSATDANPQTHYVRVYDRRPDLPGAVELCNTTYTYIQVISAIQAAANKVNISTVTSNPPGLGAVMTMTVSGDTGTIGSGEVLDPDSPFIQMGPSVVVNGASGISGWRPDVFELTTAKILVDLNDGAGLVEHFDYLKWQFTGTPADRPYVITYTFRVTGTTTSSVTPSPVQNISSGTQTKHTSLSNFGTAIQPIQPPANTTTLTKTATPATIERSAGGTVTYEVPITNAGSTARVVTDGVTTNNSTTVTSATANFTAADVGKALVGTNLPPGTAILSVTNSTTVEVTNPATASGTGITLTIGADQDIALDYITDTLPAGVTYVPGSAEFNGSSIADPIVSGSTLMFMGPLTVPAQATRTLSYDVDFPSGLAVGPYANKVAGYIGSAQIDTSTDTSDNSPATSTVTVYEAADLSVTKTASEDPIPINGILTYTLQIDNNGPSQAISPTITDTLPAGTTFQSASGSGWSCSNAGQIVTCGAGNLPVGSASPISVVVVVDATSGVLTNTATVESPTFDPDPSNNTDTITTTVNSSLAAVRGRYTNGIWGSMDIFSSDGQTMVAYHCCLVTDTWELRLPPSSCPAGGYKIIYNPPTGDLQSRWLNDKDNFTEADCISAPSNGNDMVIPASVSISGYVKDYSTSADIDGAVIYAFRESDGRYMGWSPMIESGSAGGPGRYQLNLPAGNYKLLAYAPTGYITEWYSGARTFSDSTAVAAPATEVNFSLLPSAYIEGYVKDFATAADLDGYPLYAYTSAGEFYSYGVSGMGFGPGRYRIPVMPGEAYKVLAGGGNGYSDQWFSGATNFSEATATAAPLTANFSMS